MPFPASMTVSPAMAVLRFRACLSNSPRVGGELLAWPICFNARKLTEDRLAHNARIAGATPLWEWIGAGATVFSY